MIKKLQFLNRKAFLSYIRNFSDIKIYFRLNRAFIKLFEFDFYFNFEMVYDSKTWVTGYFHKLIT